MSLLKTRVHNVWRTVILSPHYAKQLNQSRNARMRKLLVPTPAKLIPATIISVTTTVPQNTSRVSPSLEKNSAIMREVLASVHAMLSVSCSHLLSEYWHGKTV